MKEKKGNAFTNCYKIKEINKRKKALISLFMALAISLIVIVAYLQVIDSKNNEKHLFPSRQNTYTAVNAVLNSDGHYIVMGYDPQIVFGFTKPMEIYSIKIELDAFVDNPINIETYFAPIDEAFSEDNVCISTIKAYSTEEIIEIPFAEYVALRIDINNDVDIKSIIINPDTIIAPSYMIIVLIGILIFFLVFLSQYKLLDRELYLLKKIRYVLFPCLFANRKCYIIICTCVALLCWLPVIWDLVSGNRPYSYYMMEMVSVKEKDLCVFPTGEIIGNYLNQTFICEYDSLARIQLMATTFKRYNSGIIHVSLVEDNTNEEIYNWDINSQNLIDNNYINIDIEKNNKQFGMKGKKYRINVSSNDSTKGNAIALLYSSEDLYKGGTLEILGDNTNGDLIMSIYGYEMDDYERVKIWICLYSFILFELFLIYLRRKYSVKLLP